MELLLPMSILRLLTASVQIHYDLCHFTGFDYTPCFATIRLPFENCRQRNIVFVSDHVMHEVFEKDWCFMKKNVPCHGYHHQNGVQFNAHHKNELFFINGKKRMPERQHLEFVRVDILDSGLLTCFSREFYYHYVDFKAITSLEFMMNHN